jgi:hypothetical protein
MNIDELIASLPADALPGITPQPAKGPEQSEAPGTDGSAIVWLTAGPAQDAILWPTRVFPGL